MQYEVASVRRLPDSRVRTKRSFPHVNAEIMRPKKSREGVAHFESVQTVIHHTRAGFDHFVAVVRIVSRPFGPLMPANTRENEEVRGQPGPGRRHAGTVPSQGTPTD